MVSHRQERRNMRDIKQYFVNGTKIDKKIIIDSIDNVERMEDEQEDDFVAKNGRKRKRVKIRISRAGSKERICNIIENKNDLIDKTPSPFSKINNGERISQGETPKSHLASSSTKQDSEKLTMVMVGNKSGNMEDISQIVNSKKNENKLDKHIVVDLVDSSNNTSMKNIHDESFLNEKFCDDIGSQREESNAFQVLMSRGKPIQYKSPPQQSIDDVEFNEKSSGIKELKSKHKERLIVLADKKGYSKRKLADIEEGERIERNIENRVKLFKCDNAKDDSTELSIKSNRQLSGSLLDYFSKSSLELTNKDIKCVSTFIVKADVHRTETASIEPVLKPISNKIYSIKKCPKANLDLSEVDGIHVIASENLTSPLTTKQEKRQKPRWSLRIKLHSSEENNDQNDTTDDELFSPRSRSKFNTLVNKPRKLNTHVENDKIQLKHHNGHIKRKALDENESLGKQKDSYIQMNVTKNSTIDSNNEGSDTCPVKSDEVRKIEKILNDACETVITVTDDSECKIINNSLSRKKPNEKLAPLFIKRRKTDPAIVAAKRLFLQSDITDTENKTTDKKTNNGISTLPFPLISHVTQLENNSHSSQLQIQHKFSTKVENTYLPSIEVDKYKYITNYNKSLKMTEAVDKTMTRNFNSVLSEMEKHCPDVQEMWKIISTIKDKTEKKSLQRTRNRKTKSLERKSQLTESVETNQVHDCAWTCKYKPISAQEVVGNEEAAAKLKDWLSGWRVSLTKEDYSSGEEFYSSDSCNNPYNNESNQTAVLLGPHGSGKSASVYAVAKELGYNVLEVNASSRRTGKRILKELEEATKSHRIKKNNKRKSPFEQVARESDIPKISQNSLIFLEDIDLIFEEDEGFISAAYQLASNTKRPIIMTCRDICPHLSKMAPQQKKIYFQQVNGNRVSTLLELISLAETGYRLSHNCLVKLLQVGDLRKALLQLQYLLLSGLPVLSDQSTIMRPSVWQDMQRYLYKPAIKLSKRHKTKKDTNAKKSNEQIGGDTTRILSNLANDLDGLSLVSSLIDIDDTVLNTPEANAQPNLSLVENLSLYSASHRFSADIASFLSDRILYKDSNGNEQIQNSSNVVLQNQLNRGVDLALSHVTSTCLDQRVIAIDYLPTARTICRAEESRSAGNYKRGNRFFHYLHGLKVPATSMKPNILAAACRTLQEKIDKNTSTSNVVNVSID